MNIFSCSTFISLYINYLNHSIIMEYVSRRKAKCFINACKHHLHQHLFQIGLNCISRDLKSVGHKHSVFLDYNVIGLKLLFPPSFVSTCFCMYRRYGYFIFLSICLESFSFVSLLLYCWIFSIFIVYFSFKYTKLVFTHVYIQGL